MQPYAIKFNQKKLPIFGTFVNFWGVITKYGTERLKFTHSLIINCTEAEQSQADKLWPSNHGGQKFQINSHI